MKIIKQICKCILIVSDIISSVFVVSMAYLFFVFDYKFSPYSFFYVFVLLVLFYSTLVWSVEKHLKKRGKISESVFKKMSVFKIAEAILLFTALIIYIIKQLVI